MLTRDKNELISKVYFAQKRKSVKYLKIKINEASFKYLQKKKATHSKVEHIYHKSLKIQPYLKNNEFNIKDKQMLFKLRTRMTAVKANFKSMYQNIDCDLCDEGIPQTDVHLLDCNYLIENCPELEINNIVEHEDIFEEGPIQLQVTRIYSLLFDIKMKLDEATQ